MLRRILLSLLCRDIHDAMQELEKRRTLSLLYIDQLSAFPEVVTVLENLELEATDSLGCLKAPHPLPWSLNKLKSMLLHRRLKYAYCSYCTESRKLGSLCTNTPAKEVSDAHTLNCA